MSDIETRIARALVRAALNAGYAVSVCEGEEWPVKMSTDESAIMGALRSTDQDTLRFRSATTGAKRGDVLLIWGNGEDVISDHSDNDAMIALVRCTEHITHY